MSTFAMAPLVPAARTASGAVSAASTAATSAPARSAAPACATPLRLRFGVLLAERNLPPGWLGQLAQRLAAPLLASLPPDLRRRLVLGVAPLTPRSPRLAATRVGACPPALSAAGCLPAYLPAYLPAIPSGHLTAAPASARRIDLQLTLPAQGATAGADCGVTSSLQALIDALPQAAARCGLTLCAPGAEPEDQPWALAESSTLRIDLRTPWPLPCPLVDLDAARLWETLVQRLRDWGQPAPRGQPADGRLLAHHAQWQATEGCRHGTLVGALFVLGAGSGWAPLLQAVQPLNLASGTAAGPLNWRGALRAGPQRGAWLDLGLVSLRRLRRLAGAADDDGDDLSPPTRLARVPQGALPTTLPTALPNAADPGSWQGAATLARTLADDLQHGRYQPQPSRAIALHRPDKPPRWVERLARRDALAQRHLLALLSPLCERSFHPSSFGFRPGRGRPEAIHAVRNALAAGCNHVAETDIAHCFDSVPHAQVWAALDELLLPEDHRLRQALQAMLAQPCGHGDDGIARQRLGGLAQGAPLSPLLANLVLGRIDTALAALPVHYVRYADDLVVLAHGKAQAREALERIRETAAQLGLALAPDKTRIGHVQEGFTFLGEHFSPRSVEPVEAATAAQRKPLVITWPWLELGVNGPCLEARHAGKPLGRWPLRRLNALMVLAPAALSTTLLERCARHQVAVALSLRGGHDAVVLPADQRHHLERQAAHLRWHGAQSGGERLALAQALVDAKIANGQALVRQRQASDPLIDTLAEVRRQLPRAGSTTVLRGHEGHAAKLMFRWLNGQILPALRPAFGAVRRARGAPDRLNSMLNLSYHLLRSRLSILLRSRALNPYLGWLHDADDNYETLTYDLMEPFRPLMDRLVLRLINRQELRATHFEPTAGEHRLTPEGAGRLAQAFERALGERVGSHLWRDMLWVQVQAVARLARGEGAFWVFHWQPRERQADPTAPPHEGPMLALGSADDLDDGNDPAPPWWADTASAKQTPAGSPEGAAP